MKPNLEERFNHGQKYKNNRPFIDPLEDFENLPDLRVAAFFFSVYHIMSAYHAHNELRPLPQSHVGSNRYLSMHERKVVIAYLALEHDFRKAFYSCTHAKEEGVRDAKDRYVLIRDELLAE